MHPAGPNLDDPALTPAPLSDESITAIPPGSGYARKVFSLAWPVLALNSLVLLVELSDRYLVGNLQGVDPAEADVEVVDFEHQRSAPTPR